MIGAIHIRITGSAHCRMREGEATITIITQDQRRAAKAKRKAQRAARKRGRK